jgi:hypothetical protein
MVFPDQPDPAINESIKILPYPEPGIKLFWVAIFYPPKKPQSNPALYKTESDLSNQRP